MGKVITIGETTFDILFRNGQPTGAVIGGSALNTSISLGRSGIPVCFVSRMGNDRIGDLSIQFLRDNHIQCDNIVRYQGNSRLAIAFVDDPNNTEYQFYSPTVIPTLSYPETKKGDIVCYGSTHAIREEGRNDLLLFLNQARENNNLIIYDPNIRETNRLKLKTIREKVSENLQLTKILKGSTIDFDRLYNTKNIDKLFSRVNKLGVEALILTAGSDPVSLRTQSLSASFPVAPIEAVNTIG
ncbi:MAG TPA: PfkB family carbohydrate kinase, partial [Prolixibacteraceae bacterium]|nr:PfkB family carbohydrate kinase [Prolixibacteraceae bacterium]